MIHFKRNFMIFTLIAVECLLTQQALAFEKGQRVWIDMSAININDDSYGEGEVIEDVSSNTVNSVKIYVRSLTTSKAFSSGVFCASPSQSTQGWQSPAVYNLVTNETRDIPRNQLMPWIEGYNRFYERQNWLHTFLKWADHHPIIERSQLIEHRDTALSRQQPELALVNELMIQEFDAYQTPQFRPYTIPDKITKLIPVLRWITKTLEQHAELEQAWRPLKRDLITLNQTSLTLFMTEAIDKVLTDARKTRTLVLEKEVNEDTKTFDLLMTNLARK